MSYVAHTSCPVSIVFGDNQRTSARAGIGFILERINIGNATITGNWQGDPQSVVTIKHHHFYDSFTKAA